VVVKLSVRGIRGAKNAHVIIDKNPNKNREFSEFNINRIKHDINERYSIGILRFPYLSPSPANRGLEIILINTENDIINAIDLVSKPLYESHSGQNGAFIPITKNIEK